MMSDPALRGQRIGARLLAAIDADLRDRCVPLSLLETGRDQAEALRLYRAAGWLERAPFGGCPDNGLSTFMHKQRSA